MSFRFVAKVIPMFRLLLIARVGPAVLLLLASLATQLAAQAPKYFPPAGRWERKPPADVGMDLVKLKEAIDFALTY
jgi:hypothetical protein